MNEQEVWTSEPVEVSAWHWFKLGSPTDSYVRPFYRTKGAVLHPFESRSAPIPSAEEIAAMAGVCGSLRVLFANYAKARLNNEPDGRIADLAYCQDALKRFDAARAKRGVE